SQLRLLLVVLNGDKERNLPVSVTEARAESYSSGDDTVVVSLRTKYSTKERKYIIPVECLRDLIVDLQRLNSIAVLTPQPDKPTAKTKNLLPAISIISE